MRNQILFFILGLLIQNQAYALFGETYGAGSSSAAIANQTSGLPIDGSNNYYAPAFSAFGKKLVLELNTFFVSSDFEEITNITVKNNTTHASNMTGNADTTYDDSYLATFNAILPLLSSNGPKLAVSVFMPVGKLQEANTGDGFLPEYVMYRARHKRTTLVTSIAYEWFKDFAFSIGFYSGLQTSANTYMVGGGNGGTTSHGNMKVEARPSIALLASTAFKFTKDISGFFTYQQEMKQNLETLVAGEAFNPINVVYDLEINSLLYYDPHSFRFGLNSQFNFFRLILSGEYQIWDGYKPPTMQFTQKGGVIVSSGQFELIRTKNIFIPRVGVIIDLTDDLHLSGGFEYRPTPLDSDFSGAGNSIDSNSYLLSTGLSFDTFLLGKKTTLSSAIQYRTLEQTNVTKTAGEEDGRAGSKIGAGGYNIGGSVLAISAGLRLQF